MEKVKAIQERYFGKHLDLRMRLFQRPGCRRYLHQPDHGGEHLFHRGRNHALFPEHPDRAGILWIAVFMQKDTELPAQLLGHCCLRVHDPVPGGFSIPMATSAVCPLFVFAVTISVFMLRNGRPSR